MSAAAETANPRILVVRLGAMGDIVHTLPAVAALKRAFPRARLTWAVEPRWAALLAGNPHVDRVAAIDRKSRAGLAASWRTLRAEGYDFAVDFQGLFKSALTALCASPSRIFGLEANCARERAAAILYSKRRAPTSEHIVDRNLDLAELAGARQRAAEFPLPPGAAEGELPEGPFLLACPLAGWRSKQWPHEYYSALARRAPELGLTLVVNGPPSAAAELARIEGAHVNLSGLDGLLYATRRAAAVVGVDSGPLHIAAALGRPGVAIFGPTDPKRNGPYGPSFTTLRAPSARVTYKRLPEIDPSMKAITPDQVFDALKAALTGGAEARA